ncbi:MAG: hypothetical protein AAF788_00445 [Pseudomonadota bacterium]
MTSTLFLSDAVSALIPAGSRLPFDDAVLGDTILNRKGQVRRDAGTVLSALDVSGDVVACLPLSATTCQMLKVRAGIGRQVNHTDVSGALERALGQAGGTNLAVVSAEPSQIRLDGVPVEGSPVGEPAQSFEMDVTSFVSPLPFLADLEKACEEAGLSLQGVMSSEEALAASLSAIDDARLPLILCDAWHTKIVQLNDDSVTASVTVSVGAGHLALDLKTAFALDDKDADKCADRFLYDRCAEDDQEKVRVAAARLEELVEACRQAADQASIDFHDAVLVGLPPTPLVTAAFARAGFQVSGPGLRLTRKDPAILALIAGAARLAEGAVPRAATTAMQLEAPRTKVTALEWIRRNF